MAKVRASVTQENTISESNKIIVLEMREGEVHRQNLVWMDKDNNPLDLTGATLTAKGLEFTCSYADSSTLSNITPVNNASLVTLPSGIVNAAQGKWYIDVDTSGSLITGQAQVDSDDNLPLSIITIKRVQGGNTEEFLMHVVVRFASDDS